MGYPAGDRELVQIMDAALADAARRAGSWLVCRAGCTQCCYGAFAINQLDRARLREGLRELRRENPALAESLERRARAWLAEYGDLFPGSIETGLIGESELDRQRFKEFANDAPCPALDPASGRCDVYEWRPMTCRVFGPPVRAMAPDGNENGLGYCELCFEGATADEIAACEMTVPGELEQKIVDELGAGETIVAFAMLQDSAQTEPDRNALDLKQSDENASVLDRN